jgi:hypothetical protein
MSSFAARADLRLRLLKSTCATRVGLGATVSVDLCHRSGLEYLSHGFQTQGTVAAGASLKVRLESTCVRGPWISDPRYGCDHSRLVYLGHGFQTQGTKHEDNVQLKGSRQYGLEGVGVNSPAQIFKLFLQSDCQGSEPSRLFPEPPNGATSEYSHGTSEIC